MQVPPHPEHDFLGDSLNARCKVHVPLFDIAFWIPRRTTEQLIKPRVGHGQSLAIVEVVHVQPETPIRFKVDQMLVDNSGVGWSAIWCQAHELVLATVYFEPA